MAARSSATAALLRCLALACLLQACLGNTHMRLPGHDPEGYVFSSYSLNQPYDESMHIGHWMFVGDTVAGPEQVRLTPDRQSRKGGLWNAAPFNPPSDDKYPPWEVIVEFHVHGQGTKLFGDGFAFWYTKTHAEIGPVFGSVDKFTGLGIFFDTYSNVQQARGQYVSAVIGDGKISYDHNKDGGDIKLAGCHSKFRGLDHYGYARFVYEDRMLRVYLDTNGQGWEECFVIRRVYLPRGNYFGFTAATGDLADNHDIISVRVAEPAPMDEVEKRLLEKRIKADVESGVEKEPHHDPQYEDEHEEEHSPWRTVAVIVLLLGAAGGIYYVTSLQQRRAATHFT
eukprot:m.120413 g.120413  ORF g.120413 m.120413 type:complete len:340 (-) comp16177_c1_seq6:893-1912(-)